VILHTCGSRSAHSFGVDSRGATGFVLLTRRILEIPLTIAILVRERLNPVPADFSIGAGLSKI
jgi:hypothetical protein